MGGLEGAGEELTPEWMALKGGRQEVEARCLPASEVAAQPVDQVVMQVRGHNHA
jgi:hypothetical protein